MLTKGLSSRYHTHSEEDDQSPRKDTVQETTPHF